MERGLELLSHSPTSGFRVRSMRKLSLAYARSWKIGAALDLAADAHDLAQDLGALDQIRTLEKIAKKINKFRKRR